MHRAWRANLRTHKGPKRQKDKQACPRLAAQTTVHWLIPATFSREFVPCGPAIYREVTLGPYNSAARARVTCETHVRLVENRCARSRQPNRRDRRSQYGRRNRSETSFVKNNRAGCGKMAMNIPKQMVVGSMGVAGLVGLLCLLDLVLGVPFGGNTTLDILFLISAATTGYLCWDAYREMA